MTDGVSSMEVQRGCLIRDEYCSDEEKTSRKTRSLDGNPSVTYMYLNSGIRTNC